MAALLLIAWIFAALSTAYHMGARDFGPWFWLNLVLMLGIPLAGIAESRAKR